MTKTLMVTGSSGQLGKRVVEILRERGIAVLAGSRKGGDRRVDFDDDVATLARAFAGVERLLLISTDAVDRPGRRLEQHTRAIAAARQAGVQHVVYTSLTHADAEGSPVLLAPDHRATEAALAASGIPHTVLRNNLYTEGLLGALPAAIASGTLFAAAQEGRAAFVTREDCAEAAAAALISGDETRILEITGPDAISYAELAAITSEVTGKPVRHVAVEPAQLEAGMVQNGLPAPFAQLLVSFDLGIAQGLLGPATREVERLTGRAPKSVREFLVAHRGALG